MLKVIDHKIVATLIAACLTISAFAVLQRANADEGSRYVQCHGAMGYCSFLE